MCIPGTASMLRVLLGLLGVFCVSTGVDAAENWWVVSHRLAPGTALDFTPHGTQPGLLSPLIFSDNCAGCHRSNTPAQVAFRPYSSWAGSMMANATRDPLFWAALDIANKDVPGSGDYCLRCHTPRGWLEGRVVKAGFGNPDNDATKGTAGCLLAGTYTSADDLDSDFGGETCHYCHRLMPQGPNNEPGYVDNANAWVDDANCANTGDFEPCRRGPYTYAPSDQTPPHPWVQSSYHTQSAICGLCHNVTSPDTDAGPLKTLKLNNGTDTARPFPIERTFNEWQQSQYAQPAGQTCQACHMPDSEDATATACSLPGYPNRTGNLPVHAFAGGNTWVPGIIKGQYAQGIADSGGQDRSALYDQTIGWARQQLMSAASVATTIQNYTPPGIGAGSMTVAVKVTNLSGHKLPTGYAEGRRMWLNLQVHDANGGLVFESGAYDSANGVLGMDAQARIYEVQQGIFNHLGTNQCDVENSFGNAMFHFVLNDCIAKDNRIPPLGFKPATVADPNGYELRPVGATYPETTPGSGILVNYDSATYAASIPVGTPGPLTATARLYYQTSSKDYIEFLRDEAIANATQGENAMCMGAANRPFAVGPQARTRGQYVYDLWSDAVANDRVFADGFEGVALPRYGKSPPELMQTASATTSP
jgi:mono/diheme cytochrome c family protein